MKRYSVHNRSTDLEIERLSVQNRSIKREVEGQQKMDLSLAPLCCLVVAAVLMVGCLPPLVIN
jgi:hypothetical protein